MSKNKSLYNVALKTLPAFEDEREANRYKIQLVAEIRDIKSQLQEARERGTTVGGRFKSGTEDYNNWRRKAKSCLTIKNCQVQIIQSNLDENAYNVHHKANKETIQTLAKQKDILNKGLEDALEILNKFLDSIGDDDHPAREAYDCIIESLEASEELDPESSEVN